ncbi:hypothetical protein [Cellvibrio sp. PSBB006]|uniref:hypothetical protein n=1 Tax=Cellvibrio sp. PSBB006 TaxID=1987723 RepID=UPI0012FB2A7A|nr:hypothetical protein [Cellvibrio sp. PSBB006]
MDKVSSHTLLLSTFINAMIWKDRVEVCETVSGRTPLSSPQGWVHGVYHKPLPDPYFNVGN